MSRTFERGVGVHLQRLGPPRRGEGDERDDLGDEQRCEHGPRRPRRVALAQERRGVRGRVVPALLRCLLRQAGSDSDLLLVRVSLRSFQGPRHIAGNVVGTSSAHFWINPTTNQNQPCDFCSLTQRPKTGRSFVLFANITE